MTAPPSPATAAGFTRWPRASTKVRQEAADAIDELFGA